MVKKLYLLENPTGGDYDTYDSAVVCARSLAEARGTHPGGIHMWSIEGMCGSWCPAEKVKATCIGVAHHKTRLGVVCASFNAG